MRRAPPRPTLSPYTTLFRSQECHVGAGVVEALVLDLDLVGAPARQQRTAIALQPRSEERRVGNAGARRRCPRSCEQPPQELEVTARGSTRASGDLDEMTLGA